ncbi:MAG: alkaline phosphatase family protein, partial [Cyanobacteria bacterium J06626_18]
MARGLEMNINIKALAETALLERQALPPFLGAGAVRPSYDGLGLANVTALALDWLCPNATCLKGGQLPPFDPTLLGVRAVTDAWQQWQQQGAINHVVMLMMDAFGYDQLRSLVAMGDIPELATACASPQAFFMPATTTFPSTTATALTTAATAHAPAQHGAVGTMVYLPEVGSAVNLLSWRPVVAGNSSPYSDEQLNSETFLPMSNVYRRFEEYGLDTGIISLRSLQKTSLSRMMTTGSQAIEQGFMGYLTPADSFVRLRDRLSRLDHQNKSFTYCYVPNLDAAAHKYGPLSHNYRAEAAVLDFALKRELLQPLKG